MRSVDRKQVSCDRKIANHLEGPLRAARDALCEAENALATAMIEMAEANCKGVPKPERRLQEVRLAYCDAVKNLDDLRTAFPSRQSRNPNKADVKSARSPT